MLDAQLIACHVLGISRSRLMAFPEQSVSDSHALILNALLIRRINGEPVAYLLGVKEFWSAELRVAQGTLVPRPDTEILVEKALELALYAPDGYIVDLGTGSGAIVIAMALELPQRKFIAIEKSAAALEIAQTNIKTHTPDNVQLIHGSWLDSLANESVAMALANPPYLANTDSHLKQLRHEPHGALVSGTSGLEDLDIIISDTVRVAMHGAPLIVEHGSEQGAAVRQRLENQGYENVGTALDLAGHERISYGVRAPALRAGEKISATPDHHHDD